MSEREILELEKRYAPKRKVNSFYRDMSEMKRTSGSPNIAGSFSRYTYYFDKASQKMMCKELK